MLRIYIICLLCLITHCLFAQYGSLDSTFGKKGLVRTWHEPWYVEGDDMLLQPDGKILVTGGLVDSVNHLAVWRYLANGDLDISFGNQGIATMPNQPDNSSGVAIALQPDGKIVVAGVNSSANRNDLAVMRLLPSGKTDISFGNNGLVVLDIKNGIEVAYDIKVQPDGGIVVTGISTEITKSLRLLVARFRPNGTLDTSFGDQGIILPDYGPDNAWGVDITVLKEGKILVTGTYIKNESFFVHDEYILLMRFLPDGSPDLSFGEQGRVLIDFDEEDARVFSMVVQPDEKILIAGPYYSNIVRFRVLRFHSDGRMDTDFGEDGVTLIGFDNYHSLPGEIALQADGKIVISGMVDFGPTDPTISLDFALVRLSSDGKLDPTFGQGGKVSTNFGSGSSDFGLSLAIQPDHKIVVVGYSHQNLEHYSVSLARYNSNYDPPPVDTSVLQEFIRLYPNPTQGPATLEFWLGQEATVSLDVYDVQGRLLQNLWQPEVRAAGTFAEPLVLNDFIAAGAYFLVLTRDGRRNYVPLVKQ